MLHKNSASIACIALVLTYTFNHFFLLHFWNVVERMIRRGLLTLPPPLYSNPLILCSSPWYWNKGISEIIFSSLDLAWFLSFRSAKFWGKLITSVPVLYISFPQLASRISVITTKHLKIFPFVSCPIIFLHHRRLPFQALTESRFFFSIVILFKTSPASYDRPHSEAVY